MDERDTTPPRGSEPTEHGARKVGVYDAGMKAVRDKTGLSATAIGMTVAAIIIILLLWWLL
jgi:hypothetical protein